MSCILGIRGLAYSIMHGGAIWRLMVMPAMFAVAVLALGGCERRQSGRSGGARETTGPLRVIVSIAPLKGLVEPLIPTGPGRGGGGAVEVLIPVGAMEHGYEMPPEAIARALRADVVVYVGMGLEPQLEKLLRERPSAGRHEVCFARVAGEEAAAGEGHEHGAAVEEGHDHGTHGDPHLWLDPVLVERLIPAVREAIEKACVGRGWTDVMDDDGPTWLTAPALQVLAGVKRVHQEYMTELAGVPADRRVMITAHAAWGRLAGRYGLEQVPLAGLEAGEGSPEAMSAAAAVLREKRASAVFTEPQTSAAAARRIAEMTGARVLVLDPLGDGDWEKMMRANLAALVEGLGGTAARGSR